MKTHTFELHLSTDYFPVVKVLKPFYATVRYMVKDNDLYFVSLEFSSLALRHITGMAQIAEEARAAAYQNAVYRELINDPNDLVNIL